jgi:hypothetical protein
MPKNCAAGIVALAHAPHSGHGYRWSSPLTMRTERDYSAARFTGCARRRAGRPDVAPARQPNSQCRLDS